MCVRALDAVLDPPHVYGSGPDDWSIMNLPTDHFVGVILTSMIFFQSCSSSPIDKCAYRRGLLADETKSYIILLLRIHLSVTVRENRAVAKDRGRPLTSTFFRHVQYSSLVRVETLTKLNIRLVRVVRVEEVSVILFMEMT